MSRTRVVDGKVMNMAFNLLLSAMHERHCCVNVTSLEEDGLPKGREGYSCRSSQAFDLSLLQLRNKKKVRLLIPC